GRRRRPRAVSEPQPRGLRRDVPVQDLRVRAVRELLEEVVLDGPQAVEAGLLAEHRLLDDVLVRFVLAVAAPRPRDRDLVEQCQLQGLPFPERGNVAEVDGASSRGWSDLPPKSRGGEVSSGLARVFAWCRR